MHLNTSLLGRVNYLDRVKHTPMCLQDPWWEQEKNEKLTYNTMGTPGITEELAVFTDYTDKHISPLSFVPLAVFFPASFQGCLTVFTVN